MSEIAGVDAELVGAVIDLLRNFPANGKPPNDDARLAAHSLGFIEYREIKRPCKTCGTERFDHSYFKPTAAGKLFLAAWDRHAMTKPTATQDNAGLVEAIGDGHTEYQAINASNPFSDFAEPSRAGFDAGWDAAKAAALAALRTTREPTDADA